MKVYLIGSLRNPKVPTLGNLLRHHGHEVFDDWYAAGPEADDYWQEYETAKGLSYQEALSGAAANHVYQFDKKWLDWCDVAVLLLPAGRSGHMEFGYCIGQGKRGYILMEEGEPDRWDVMYRFATDVVYDRNELMEGLKNGPDRPDRAQTGSTTRPDFQPGETTQLDLFDVWEAGASWAPR